MRFYCRKDNKSQQTTNNGQQFFLAMAMAMAMAMTMAMAMAMAIAMAMAMAMALRCINDNETCQ